LNAEVGEEFGVLTIDLSYSVDYGYWLEVIENGKFAIIMPTLEALGPEILDAAGASVFSITGVGGEV
jgi:hypothetical protein